MLRQIPFIKSLMIVSLLCSVFSSIGIYAQNNDRQIEDFEQQVLNNLSYPNPYDLSGEKKSPNLPEKIKRVDQQSERSIRISSRPNQNYIQLHMNGDQNQVRANQLAGKNNYMDLDVDGNANQGRYLQKGSNNYIFDRISGEGVTREIQQFGNGLGIYNQGIPALPMKIIQRGTGMKLLIKKK